MGISGHMLGARKLRKLATKTGLPLERAYIRNHESEGRVIVDGQCVHYDINPDTGESRRIDPEVEPYFSHWSSCPGFQLPGEAPMRALQSTRNSTCAAAPPSP